jgi:hypothetical protein
VRRRIPSTTPLAYEDLLGDFQPTRNRPPASVSQPGRGVRAPASDQAGARDGCPSRAGLVGILRFKRSVHFATPTTILYQTSVHRPNANKNSRPTLRAPRPEVPTVQRVAPTSARRPRAPSRGASRVVDTSCVRFGDPRSRHVSTPTAWFLLAARFIKEGGPSRGCLLEAPTRTNRNHRGPLATSCRLAQHLTGNCPTKPVGTTLSVILSEAKDLRASRRDPSRRSR